MYSASFSPDSSKLVSAAADKTVKFWDVATQSCDSVVTISSVTGEVPFVGDMQVSVLWTPTRVVSVSLNGNINFIDPGHPSGPIKVLQGHQVAITGITLDRATGVIYSGI